MSRVIETKVYLYSELTSESAKERARQWYTELMDASDYSEYVINDAAEIAGRMGVEFKQRPYQTMGGKERHAPCVWWSGFCCQGDGASFEGWFDSKDIKTTALEAVKDHAPVDPVLHALAHRLDAALATVGQRIRAKITTSGHYSHSGTMDFEFEYPDDETGEVCFDAEETEIEEIFKAFADWIYRQLETEYEYRTSEEALAETFEANEYTFLASGERWG